MMTFKEGKTFTILSLPQCFAIKIIKKYAVEYGLTDDEHKICLFVNGCEEMLSDDIELGVLYSKELFCLHENI